MFENKPNLAGYPRPCRGTRNCPPCEFCGLSPCITFEMYHDSMMKAIQVINAETTSEMLAECMKATVQKRLCQIYGMPYPMKDLPYCIDSFARYVGRGKEGLLCPANRELILRMDSKLAEAEEDGVSSIFSFQVSVVDNQH